MRFKKLVCMGMAIVFACSNLPQITIQAQQIQEDVKEVNPTQEGQEIFKYEELEDGTLKITGYIEDDDVKKVIIPTEIEEKKVTSIGDNAFSRHSNLSSIIIPEGVTSIGDLAFYECSNLSSISLPKKLTLIGDNAFGRCSNLSSIIIPEGVTSIGTATFSECSNLSKISLPEELTSIGVYAFRGCSNLKEIVVHENNKTYTSENGILYNKDKTTLICCPAGREVVIPKGVTSIGDFAFSDCSNLRSVIIPEGVTSIGNKAFYCCNSLNSINLPEGVTFIGDWAFYCCNSLNSINLPEGVTFIGDWAFCYCDSLNSINLPEGVTSIGSQAFCSCSSLMEIMVSENNKTYTSENGILYNKDRTTLICCPEGKIGEVVIPKGVKFIGNDAFNRCGNLNSISLPEGITSIGTSAFSECRNLSNIVIPKEVTLIGDFAFYGCSSLSSISLPEGVTSIGTSLFNRCSSLSSISLPKGVTLIGDFAFYGCSSLSSISLPEGVTSIGTSAFNGCSLLGTISIPERVTSIGAYAFKDCNSNLTFIITSNSYAETYAKENNINYCYIGDIEECTHNYTSEITTNPSCNKEGVTTYTCIKCGNTYTESMPATKHKIVKDIAVAATCTTEGKTAGSHCSVCKNVIKKQETVLALGHTYKSKIVKATTKKNGSITQICNKCGTTKGKAVIIYVAKNIKLSKTSFTYNNKVQKPSITVTDSKGKALKKGKDYTVTYPKGMKNVGKYTITIQLKGNYKGSITKTFTIVPKKVEITKIITKSKGFTIKWKKQTKQVTGYQIFYATNKNFAPKVTKTKTISNAKATTKTISKLKAKKVYYIRIRSYKEVKVNGKMTKLYSNWSKSKTVTTKK